MTARAKLGGKLPDPMRNGLAVVADQFEDKPDQKLTIISTFSVRSIRYLVESGDAEVEFQIDEIEPIGGADEGFVKSTMRSAREKRTGVKELDQFGDAMSGADSGGGIPVGEHPDGPPPDADGNDEIQPPDPMA